MPTQVRIIAGPRDKSFDHFIQELLDEDGFGVEREYFGIEDQSRADLVRRKLRTAGRHLDVSVKAFWAECQGCPNGGPTCRYHVKFTAYDPDEARKYMERKGQYGRGA